MHYDEFKKDLAYYSVYVKVAIALLIGFAIFVVLFVFYKTFYLATIIGGALSGLFGIITVMAQESQSIRRVAKIIVNVSPEVQWKDQNHQIREFILNIAQINKGARAGNKVVTFIKLYVEFLENKDFPIFSPGAGLIDISVNNKCPIFIGGKQIMVNVFASKQDLMGARYPGINVTIGRINIDEESIKNYRVLTLEADTYEEFTHSNQKILIAWNDYPKDLFPSIKSLSEKFEHY